MQAHHPDRWVVRCRCGLLDRDLAGEADAERLDNDHVALDCLCGSTFVGNLGGVGPLWLLGIDTCDSATIVDRTDGAYGYRCRCGYLDGQTFDSQEGAEDAMDEHLDAEDARG